MWHYYNSVLWSLYVSVYLQICDSRANSSDTPGCILALRTWMKWFTETKGRWWKYLRVWIHISYTLRSRGGGLRHWGPSISLVPCHYWHFFSACSLRRNLDLLQQNHKNNNLNFQLDCLLNKKLHLVTLVDTVREQNSRMMLDFCNSMNRNKVFHFQKVSQLICKTPYHILIDQWLATRSQAGVRAKL